jgi:tetratricopeptide (TPR) repeat protein
MVRHYSAPERSGSISIEPRVVHRDGGTVTTWDILVEADATAWEVKLNATRQDLLDWMTRIREMGESGPKPGLAYGQTNTPLLAALGRFHQVAVECESDFDKFDSLVTDNERLDVVSSHLGPGYRDHLRRMVFVHQPEAVLKNSVQDRAKYLVGPNRDRMIDFLFKTFFEGAAERRRYTIVELIQRAEASGIGINPQAEVVFAEVPATAREALTALALCPAGLSQKALAAMLRADESSMMEELRPFIEQALIANDGEALRAAAAHPLRGQTPPERGVDWLDSLLSWLAENETADSAGLVARASLNIARSALRSRPGLALKLFQATEHVIKNLGDKHLLLEVSELCIHAANDPSAIDRDLKAKAKAQAMLCGHSWVLQRTDRLPEATVWAKKSERLGDDIGWDRNTAFAKKCIARLDRLAAEQSGDSTERASFLQESETKLRAAIEIFSQSHEFGPTDRQVGDCYSLLARTQFVVGDLAAATESLRKAYEILVPGMTKEYFDLLILTGDIELAKGNRDAAEHNYTEVVDVHSSGKRELSEICARSYLRRGRLRVKAGRKAAAASDLARAAEIWDSLDETTYAAEAEWERMHLDSNLDPATRRLFSAVQPTVVRVEAVRSYQSRLQGTKVAARRAIPTQSQVAQFAKEARKRIAEEHPEW